MTTVKARPGIPRDDMELIRDFGPFIANEIRKRNTVSINFDDAYQEVCTSLFKAKVIEKFQSRDSDEYPETMTLAEVLVSLGITVENWRIHQSNYRCKGGLWMPEALNAPGPGRGWLSKTATFSTADILRIDCAGHSFKNRLPISKPVNQVAATPYQFLNYLGVAVRRHFANFCRTRSRKWQDCLGDQTTARVTKRGKNASDTLPLTARPTQSGVDVPQFRNAEGGYNDHWADTIRDGSAESCMEARVELQKVLDRFSAKVPEQELRAEIFKLVHEKNYTLAEAIMQSSMASNRKRVVAKAFLSAC